MIFIGLFLVVELDDKRMNISEDVSDVKSKCDICLKE